MGEAELTTSQRMLAGMGGAAISAVVVTPMDVVKTRVQTAPAQPVPAVANDMYGCPPRPCPKRSACKKAGTCLYPGGQAKQRMVTLSSMDAMRSLIEEGGVRSLWRGLVPSLAMSIPAVGIYMTAYEQLRDRFYQSPVLTSFGKDVGPPLLAGVLSRTLASVLTAPVELVKTRLQAGVQRKTGPAAPSMASELRSIGVAGLFKGLTPFLLRDIPFSAAYWVLVEQARAFLSQPGVLPLNDSSGRSHALAVNFIAGLSAGSVAAAVTCPADVLKTRVQVLDGDVSVRAVAKDMYAQEGASAFLRGLGPRVARIAPSCAVVIASYELFKSVIQQRRRQAAADEDVE
eukprot:PLAT7833.1.p1 GENE.PLAT7833.1~~PLAT7833.1.p1  ORF type:complete len:344 (+),score=136.18 PLAT7833.1:18-1049(+)